MKKVGELARKTTRRLQTLGVDPALVLRFELAEQPDLVRIEDRLAAAGLSVVGIEPGRRVIVAFRADDDLREFTEILRRYQAGPRVLPSGQQAKSTKWDVLEWIDPATVREWGREDRLGPRIRGGGVGNIVFDPTALHTLDLELWHAGTDTAARRSVAKIEELLRRAGEGQQVFDRFVGTTLCLMRVQVLGTTAEKLLLVPEVAMLDLPPRCSFDPGGLTMLTRERFPVPPRPTPDGPRVCTLDSGVTALHPLLASNIGHAASFHSRLTSGADGHGHGTAVAGIAVFGDVRGCVARNDFASDVTLFSARLLDDQNRLDERKLVINQIREAVVTFSAPPYDCRVFNLSIGDEDPILALTGGRQGPWAEALDVLARELGVLFVVSAGNAALRRCPTDEAEQIAANHPQHLSAPEHGLVDPATAAIAVTVGAIALRADVTRPRPGMGQDIVRPVANVNEPAPYTRVGPGVAGAIKPDFVEDGGNMALSGFGGARTLDNEPASAVWSFSRDATRTLFVPWTGTSFAAPRVARTAALTAHALRRQLGRPPSANLVRAVLGVAADAPRDDYDQRLGRGAAVRFCGYGRVDEEFALSSSDRRVVLVAEEKLALDHFLMFEVPVPDAFVDARGRKRLSVALAFDPPVRARRADYLGVEMDVSVYRGVDGDVLFERIRSRTEDEEEDRPEVEKRNSVKLEPGAGKNREFGWTRSKATLQVGRTEFSRLGDYRGGWWVVVRARRRWAPAEVTEQAFGIAVVLEASAQNLYTQVRARIQQRGRERARV